jgi:NADPH:quinone reductase
MRAWQVRALGEPVESMEIADLPVPQPGPGQVLVEVAAAALNFPDVLLVRGQYQEKPPLPFTPGLELCGEIVRTGEGVPATRVGERVLGTVVLPRGSLAGYALADAASVFEAPPKLDDAHAAALHLTYQTAWTGLYRRALLHVGEVLLVYGAAGGVGSAAVQLGKAAGARVLGVVGSPAKVEVARQLGADVVIDRSSTDVIAAVKEATANKGVDVVFDPLGGEWFTAATKVVAFEGRIVSIGFASGELPQAAVNHALIKNYSILGVHWGLYRQRNPGVVERAHADLCRLVEAGIVRPLVSEQLKFDDAPLGIARLAGGATVGKLVVEAP